MAAEKRVDDLRHDRLFVADDAVEDGFAGRETGEEVGAKLILYRLESAIGRAERRALECAKCFWINRQLILRGKMRA